MTDKRKEIWETLDAALTKSISNAYATGQSDERQRIIALLEDSFYPLNYSRWQADELMDEIFRLIKGEE